MGEKIRKGGGYKSKDTKEKKHVQFYLVPLQLSLLSP
jgi:hypothetical protein